jgi:hypothetical protein
LNCMVFFVHLNGWECGVMGVICSKEGGSEDIQAP